MSTFQERLDEIQARIAAACERAGRPVDDVTLVAVSKTYGPDRVREAAECGLTLFGENRVQELQSKVPMCPSNLEWHLIGTLQRNKVKQVVNLVTMIHSVDSLKLLEEIDKRTGKIMPVLLQVNVSGEASKSGMAPDEVAGVIEAANQMSNIEVHGLMTIPPFAVNPDDARKHFVALRELRDRVQEETGTPLPELSMGMSGDFEVAIEEGATFVRVGSSLFGARDYK
ncbi:YggS family pyridoxal phosphate-dependent enzyme [Verrucomicrobiota bacterium]